MRWPATGISAKAPAPAPWASTSTSAKTIAQRRREVVPDLLAHRQQQPSGFLGQIGRQLGVGATHHASIADRITGTPPDVPAARFAGMRMLFALPVAALALSGCGSAAVPEPLTGTRWQLLSIESMAPAEQPSTTIDEPGLYRVTFGDDGRATFQVHCNRGSSTWQAEAAAPDSGSLTFGELALTRMFCPQPSAGTLVAAALGHVRSYLLSDGKLHMSLQADGGIMHWERGPS